ncbi:MAG: hypothetical protein HC904_02750 [Blastochloris sp.]|nr:hypothetical protein [Blastochloris sp.]
MKMLRVTLLFLMSLFSLQAESVDRVYEMGSADPAELEFMIRQVLSKEGKVVVLKDRGKLLVQDRASVHETVALILADVNKPRPNVKVEVIFNEETSTHDQSADVGFRVGGRDVQVGNRPGPNNSVDLNLRNQRTTTSRSSGQFLVVQSGMSASLRVVTELPFVDYFYQFARGRGYVVQETRWRDIGSQMSVRPLVRGNLIEVELMPQITALVDGRREIIDYRDLATTVVVADGQEVALGGFQGAGDEFNRNFFSGGGSSRRSQSSGFKLRASIFNY